ERTYHLTLPSDANVSGQFVVTVTTDSAASIFENNGAGTGESNNQAQLSLLSAPDLQVTALTLDASPLVQSGATATITWQDSNLGTGPTLASWWDHVTVVNKTTGGTLLATSSFYDPNGAGNGPVGPGDSRTRQYSFRLPDGSAGAGALEVMVTADSFQGDAGQIREVNVAGDAEQNNSRTV